MVELETPKGVRDFLPEEKIIRNYIVSILTKTFEKYGYNPLETPALELLSTLTAKDGAGEGSDANQEIYRLTDQAGRKLGLRFDLTVPLSRVVAMNPQLAKPFKRYQIDRAWRDGPTKVGRYKEFWQCDFDVVGTSSVVADAEVLAIYAEVFKELGLKVNIKVNNRKLLNGILRYSNLPKQKWMDAIMSIDKLDKIGRDGVIKDALERGIDEEFMVKSLDILEQEGTNAELLKKLGELLNNEEGKEGLLELKNMLNYASKLGVKDVTFSPSLARGLSYYTGPIFEVVLKSGAFRSSLGGGGRYDNLVKLLSGGAVDLPATGACFGLDTIYDALKIEGKFPTQKSVVKVYVVPIGDVLEDCLKILKEVRDSDINADIDLVGRAPSRNFAYVDSQGIPYALVIGKKELEIGKVTLKDMKKGAEKKVTLKQAIKLISDN